MKRDKQFSDELERVLDEHFPKIHEEGEAKRRNKRGEALCLFAMANLIHNRILEERNIPLSPTSKSDIKSAYQAGADKRKNGANESNCHFSHFSTPEKSKAWERGAEGKLL